MPKNIVWTAVIAAVAAVASIGFALAGEVNLVIAFGAAAITSAVLSGRER